MLDQEIIWTALPNGIEGRDGNRVLKLSIFVSPRLKPQSVEGNLGQFQDFKNWTEKVKEMDFAVQFEHLGQSKTVDAFADRTILEPSMWSKLFPEDTYIKAHEFDNYSEQTAYGNGIISLFELIKRQYQIAALDSLLDCNNSGGGIDDPHNKSFSILDKIPDECIRWDDEIARSMNEKFSKSFFLRRDAVKSNDIGKIELDIADVFLRFMLFHHGPIDVPEDSGNLFNEIDFDKYFDKYIDFHQAISSLGDYPEIMRRLGLIIDIEVPADQVPAMAHDQIGYLKAVTSWKSSLGKPPIMLETAFIWDGSRFETSPKPPFPPSPSKIVNGFLRLYPDFYLVSLDVDNGGLNMIHEAVRRRSYPPVNTQDENFLPSLRSDGISLTQNGRGEIASRKMCTMKKYNDALARGHSLRLYAEDTLRGYRVDIKDTSSGQWHSLCRRKGTYSIEGLELNITDEGCIQMGMIQAPTCSKDNELFINDSILTWRGWSLVAPRSGKSINADTNGSPVVELANEPVTPFKLKTSFKAAPGSLPKLRFGTGYFLRARVVDIAGNSVSLEEEVSENSEIVLPSDPLGFKYLRYEPIISPTVIAVYPEILEENKGIYKPGESLERLVIRTKNTDLSLDGENEHSSGFSSPGISERYVVPPRTSQLMAETHGMFDSDYKLKSDGPTYDMIDIKDRGKFPEWNGFPIGMHNLKEVPYLPDTLSRGAAIRNLPGTSEGTILRPNNKGALIPIQLPGVKARSGSVTMIDFGEASEWPNAKPFRLKLIEKLKDESPEPQWDEVKRHLTVKLPKAETATVLLSSYCEEEDLKIMGIWQWIKEYVDQELKDSASVTSIDQIKNLSDKLADLTQLALEGGFWMLTPNRKITLIHAVQQPIGKPEFKELSAARDPGSSFTYLLGVINVHGKSTIKLDITSEWSEPVDMSELDPSSGPLKVKAYVGEVPLQIIDGPKPLELMSGNWVVGEYFPETDTIGFYRLPTKIHAPRHEFGDTKHRIVRYRATASSRFREYFSQDDDLDFTRTSDEIVVNIPSSARPAAPKVLYVIPTFGWKRQTSTNLIASERLGGGLRVYLERPWYSSGEGELLGVVLLNDLLQPDRNAEREKFKHYITQWGADPIWNSNSVPSLPKLENFPKRIDKEKDAYNLSLDETSEIKVGVAGHEVEYDSTRKLWYCDIDIDTHKWENGKIVDETGASYYPFIRMALARYQPSSISDAHLSKVVLADFVQITPDRSVVVTYDPYNPAVLNVAVAGYSYKPLTPDNERIEVVIESLSQELEGDLGWKRENEAEILRDIETASENLIWKGQVTLPSAGGQKFRLVLKEHEYLYVDDGASQSIGKRLVFAETIEL